MTTEKRVQRTAPFAWRDLREIRELVRDELSHLSEEVQAAAAMTSSELLENAVKYGDTTREENPTTFTLAVSPDDIRIEISNPFSSEDDIRELRELIARIALTNDKEDLYVSRLSEFLTDERARGKLGLYRIAFEAAFDLRCTSADDVVTVIATRKTS